MKENKQSSARWYAISVLSCLVSLAFAAYNLVIGISYQLVWNFSISFYYLVLLTVKAVVLVCEFRWRRCSNTQKNDRRKAVYLVSTPFLFAVDFVLVAPIVLLILQRRQAIDLGMIPTIALAAYTTYKIIFACINYSRAKKLDNLSFRTLKTLNLKETVTAVITLQNTMIVTFGNVDEMLMLTYFTTAALFLLLLVISVKQVLFMRKLP